ncbi:MAG: beta-propeller domain-containing protein [Thiotrichaceae bacterium]
MKTIFAKFYIVLITVVILASCGGGSSEQPQTPEQPEIPEQPPGSSNKTPLKPVDNTELENQIKAALLKRYGQKSPPIPILVLDSATEGSANFSTTNLQVAAVDEADRLKNDADYLYVASVNTSFVKAYKADNYSNSRIRGSFKQLA